MISLSRLSYPIFRCTTRLKVCGIERSNPKTSSTSAHHLKSTIDLCRRHSKILYKSYSTIKTDDKVFTTKRFAQQKKLFERKDPRAYRIYNEVFDHLVTLAKGKLGLNLSD